MRLFDTHCHLDFNSYDDDREAVIQRAWEAGLAQLVIPAVDFASMERARSVVQGHDTLWMAVGVHPNSTANWTGDEIGDLRELVTPKVVSVGEIGLDYYWKKSSPEVQKRAFEQQLGLAAELELPVIIHTRDSIQDTLPILEAWVKTIPDSLRGRAGVIHSFSGSLADAERALAIGFYIGFTGPVTYKKADELRHVAARVPVERILIETDGPFLTPHPHRGKRNEPAYVALVAERIAALHQMDTDEFANITTANGIRLFNLG